MKNDVVEQIKNYAKLNDQRSFCNLAKYLLENIESLEKMTITSLSQKTNTSCSTVTRFCQRLGFTGFKNFKFFLIWERDDFLTWNKYFTPMNDGLSFLSAVEKNLSDYRHETTKFLEAAKLINKSKKIFIYGFGGNSHLIKIFQNYLIRLNLNAIFLQDRDDQLAYSQLANESSLNIIVSYKFRDSRWVSIFKNIRANDSPCLIISKKLENNRFLLQKDLVLDFRFSEGFEFYRDNSEVSMLMILLLLIEKIVILSQKQKMLKHQDVW